MKLIALTLLALAGSVAADQALCTQGCMNTYLSAANSDPMNLNAHALEYQTCVQNCYGFSNSVSLADCGACVNTYQGCVNDNPYDWERCLTTYNSCLGGCSWARSPAPVTMKTCKPCFETYQTCLNNSTRHCDRETCLDNYNKCLGECNIADDLGLDALKSRVSNLEREVASLKDQLSKQKQDIIASTLEHIRTNGLKLGNRWLIKEEGSGSYEALVFRDHVTSKSKDSRYAMYKGLYRDL